MKIKELHLSNRTTHTLIHHGITTVEKLTQYTLDDIKSLHLIGPSSIAEIMAALDASGLSLAKGRNTALSLETPIESLCDRTDDLHLGRPAMYVLRRGGINTIKDLLETTDLMGMKHIGVVKAAEIERVREKLRKKL